MDKSTLDAWRLFITVHAKLITHIDARLAEAGQIPLHWYDVLIELYEAPERKLRMHELAEKVVLSRSGLTRLVDRLEREGYLRRELDANDRRGFYAILTEKGVEALRSAWPIYREGIVQYFGVYVNENEAEFLVRIFSQILDNIQLK